MLVDKKPSFLHVLYTLNCPQQRLDYEHTSPWSSSLPFVSSPPSSYCRVHLPNKLLASKSLFQVVCGGRGDGSQNNASSLITGISTYSIIPVASSGLRAFLHPAWQWSFSKVSRLRDPFIGFYLFSGRSLNVLDLAGCRRPSVVCLLCTPGSSFNAPLLVLGSSHAEPPALLSSSRACV